jgi:hypothetical protein
VMSRYSAACGFEESPHTRRPCLMPQPCPWKSGHKSKIIFPQEKKKT